MQLNCRCESTFQDSIFVRYPYVPGQADKSMFTAWTGVPPPQPEHVTQTHLPLFSSNVWTFLHLLSLSFSPSLLFFWLIFSLSDAHWLSLTPCPLPLLFVSRSVDQFSVQRVGWYPHWLPRPSHLLLPLTPHLLTPWAYGRLPNLNSQ